jgi:tRNA A37 threonylcarbamoyltransferase TsaD
LEVERHFVSSQVDIHAKYGGVVPEVAARRMLRHDPILQECFRSEVFGGIVILR